VDHRTQPVCPKARCLVHTRISKVSGVLCSSSNGRCRLDVMYVVVTSPCSCGSSEPPTRLEVPATLLLLIAFYFCAQILPWVLPLGRWAQVLDVVVKSPNSRARRRIYRCLTCSLFSNLHDVLYLNVLPNLECKCEYSRLLLFCLRKLIFWLFRHLSSILITWGLRRKVLALWGF
jgi:hypothetical protein